MSRTPRQRPRLSSLGLASLRDYLSDRDIAIVRTVYTCRLVSTKHIERLHFLPYNRTAYTAARICRRVLQRLTDEQVLRRRERRIGGVRAGSASYVYALGPVGARLISDKRLHYYTSDPSDYFLEHTLALAELYVQLHEQARLGKFNLLEVQTEPPCWRTFTTLEAGRQTLKPDMYMRLGKGDEEISYFIEMDRGTTYAASLLKKLKTYEQYFASGKEQDNHGVFPQILWIAPDGKRKAMLEKVTEQINKRLPGICAVTTANRGMVYISDPP
jgi:hypothetical protein